MARSNLINSLTLHRQRFFKEIAQLVPKFKGKFIVLTHLLSDREELLHAIHSIGQIGLVIAIPYSVEPQTLQALSLKFPIITPTLSQLRDLDFLMTQLDKIVGETDELIILEIGGYFAPIVRQLRQKLKTRFLGAIESTEAGHRQYESRSAELSFPVISVCRGSLKKTEYSVVGDSCLFSTERIMRNAGFLLQGRNALVLGFGKVGQGIARGLARHACIISVYDTNPILRVLAYSEGYQVPEKETAINNAQIIFGATGNASLVKKEFTHLKNGCILVSTSSKDIEFDIEFIRKNYQMHRAIDHIDVCSKGNQFFYLLGEGTPINFIDGAVMGPVLALVHAEIIYAIKAIMSLRKQRGIFEVAESDRQMLAAMWLKYFNHDQLGTLYEYAE